MVFLRQQTCIACFFFRSEDSHTKTVCKWRHNLDIPTDIWVMCINPIDLNETNITQSQLSRKQDTPRDPSNLPQSRCWKCFGIRSVATRFANSKFTSQIQPTGSFVFRPPHSFVSCFAVPITIFAEWQPEEQNVPTKNWNWLWQTWRPFSKSHWSPIWIKLVAPWKRSDPIHWPEQCWIRQVLACMPKVVQLSCFSFPTSCCQSQMWDSKQLCKQSWLQWLFYCQLINDVFFFRRTIRPQNCQQSVIETCQN